MRKKETSPLQVFSPLPHSKTWALDGSFQKIQNSHGERLHDPLLKAHYRELSTSLHEVLKTHQWLPQQQILNHFLEELERMGHLSEKEMVAKIDDHFREMSEKGRNIYNTILLLQEQIDGQQVVLKRPYPLSELQWVKGDPLAVQIRKGLRRAYFLFKSKPERDIPLRKIAKFNLESLISSSSLAFINSWYRLLGQHIEIFQTSLEKEKFDISEIVSSLSKENDLWFHHIQSDFNKDYERMSETWVCHLNQINTPYLADSQIRHSQVEPFISQNFQKAKKNSLAWEEKFVYCRNRLKVIVQSGLLATSVKKLLDEKFFGPIQMAKTNIDHLVKDILEFLNKMETEIKETEPSQRRLYEKIHQETQSFSEQRLQADLKTKYIRGSFRLLNRDISISLKKSLPKGEGAFQMASRQTPAHQVTEPHQILVKKVNLTELFEQSIMINFLPVIEERMEGVSNYLESLLMEMEQALSIIHYSIESQWEEGELQPREFSESLLHSIESERHKINDIYQGLLHYMDSSKTSTEQLAEEVQLEVRQGIERFSGVKATGNQFREHLHQFFQKMKRTDQQINNWFSDQFQKAKKRMTQQSSRAVDDLLKKKIQSKTLDTTTIRRFIRETYAFDREIQALPRLYSRLFSLDPIQDKRFFVAHREHFKYFEPLTREESSSQSRKILIIGDRGSGKSSLLNVAQIDLYSPRLIRLEGENLRDSLGELAENLNVKNHKRSILAALGKERMVVIIDNVDQMLNRKHPAPFENLLEIMKRSSDQVHWVLSMTKYNLHTLDKVFSLRSVFNQLIDLHDIDLETAKEIILGRHRFSGLEIDFPKTLMGDLALKMGVSTENEMFFRVLYERSGGHLRHLIYLWVLSLSGFDGKRIQLSLEQSLNQGLPMVHEFSVLQKYILHELYCFHAQSLEALSQSLGVSPPVLENEIQYLEQCTLISTRGLGAKRFEIPHHLLVPLGHELKKEGLLYEGFNSTYR